MINFVNNKSTLNSFLKSLILLILIIITLTVPIVSWESFFVFSLTITIILVGKIRFDRNKIIIATNQNDLLDRLMVEGKYVKGQVHKTLSPSMDIQISSNFERLLFEALGQKPAEVVRLMNLLETEDGFTLSSSTKKELERDFSSGSSNDLETVDTIRKYYRSNNILLCPHSAIGVKVAEEHLSTKDVIVSFATAHPGKFKNTVERAIGEPILLPENLEKVLEKKEIYKVVPLNNNLIASEIRKEFIK